MAAAVSYYYIYMNKRGWMGRNRDNLNMEEQKMNENIDEKYRIKPRKKYARQVWSQDGRAVLVDPVEKKEE